MAFGPDFPSSSTRLSEWPLAALGSSFCCPLSSARDRMGELSEDVRREIGQVGPPPAARWTLGADGK